MATVQQIYIAIFGRPADPVGLAYWNEQTNNGADLSAMIAAFTAAPEYEARFEGQSNEEIISSIYQSLFGREPDDEGLEFYAEALANGELPIETIAVRILDGAQNEDQTSIENKTEAADKFTASIDTPEEIEAYQGTQAATEAQEFLETVNEDPESVPSDEDVDQAVKEVNEGDYNPPEEEPEVPGGPGGDGNGVVRALTSDKDTISTGSGDDIINASAKNSLNIGDVIDGGDGDDELNISAGAIADDDSTTFKIAAYAPAVGPKISGVETINNSDVDGLAFPELDLTNVKGLDELWTDFSSVKWTPDADGEETTNTIGARYSGNTSPYTVFGISNVAEQVANTKNDDLAGRATLSFNGGTGTFNLALSGNAVGSYYAAGAADSFTDINIDAFAGNSGTIAVSDTATSIKVTGAGDLTFLERAFDDLANFNASGASGDIDFAASALAEGATLTGGLGSNDSLILDTSGDVIDLPQTIEAFETINLFRSGVTDAAAVVDATAFDGATEIWQVDEAGDIENVGEGQTAGFRGTDTSGFANEGGDAPFENGVNVEFDGATGTVALDDVAHQSQFAFWGSSLTTLSISGNVVADDDDAPGRLQVWGLGNGELRTINLDLDTDTSIGLYENVTTANENGLTEGTDATAAFAGVTTFNASASKGGLIIGLGDSETPSDALALESLILGSGDDQVQLNAASFQGKISIDLGDGDDTLDFEGGVSNAVVVDSDIGGLITVNGLTAEETLRFEDELAASAVDIDTASDATLYDAVTDAIAADSGSAGNLVFEFDGSAYLYVDNGDSSLGTGDGLIEFVGLSASDLATFVGPE